MEKSLSTPSTSTSRNQSSSETVITDVDEDALAKCASYLSLQDLSNMAMTCKYFKTVAYSDYVWLPRLESSSTSLETSGIREAYLARRRALRQFKFIDPFGLDIIVEAKPFDHLLMDKTNIYFSQGSSIGIMKFDGMLSLPVSLNDHKARITCMRLFPLTETSLFRIDPQKNNNFLVTSSCDHSIRLWWKGSCQRCFRGHSGPISTLSDKLLGDGPGKVLASGGEDGTVRLWSLSSSGKRGQRALKSTLYGHVKPIKLISVAGHKTSLLTTISTDSTEFQVRVWDTTIASSASRSSCCVGRTSIPGAPVNIKCHESLLYVAAGSSVVTIDLRTMQKVNTAAVHQPKLYSFEALPSKSLICTGGIGSAMLWDIRRNQEPLKPEPIAEMDGHEGPVSYLHMDPYKIVTAGPEDSYVNVWDVDTGTQTNGLSGSCLPGTSSNCSGVAVDGCRIVTTHYSHQEHGVVCFRDFTEASCPISSTKNYGSEKFWDSMSYSESDSESDEADE